jgi:hypothetical protein
MVEPAACAKAVRVMRGRHIKSPPLAIGNI